MAKTCVLFHALLIVLAICATASAYGQDISGARVERMRLGPDPGRKSILFDLAPGQPVAVTFRARAGLDVRAQVYPFVPGTLLSLAGPAQGAHPPLPRNILLEGIGRAPFNDVRATLMQEGQYAVMLDLPTRDIDGDLIRRSLTVELRERLPVEERYERAPELPYQPDVDEAQRRGRRVFCDPVPCPIPYTGLGTLQVSAPILSRREATTIFQAPSQASIPVGSLDDGARISEKEAISHLKGWYAVSVDDDEDGVGWISGEDLKVFEAARFPQLEGRADTPPPTFETTIDVPRGAGPVRWKGVLVDEVRALSFDLEAGTILTVQRSEAMSANVWSHLFDPFANLEQLLHNGPTYRILAKQSGTYRLELFATGDLVRDETSGEPRPTEVLLMAE